MATVSTPTMTAEEFFDWACRSENAGKRYELDRGRVIEMLPPSRFHGTVCFLVARILGNYLFEKGTGSAATNDSGLIVGRNPDSVRGPDVMVFLAAERLDDIPRKPSEQVPVLVVEVLSPSDAPNRTLRRIDQYHARGVSLVWVIDPEERTVAVYKRTEIHKLLDESDELTGNGVLPDFRCRVADLFALPGQPSAPPSP